MPTHYYYCHNCVETWVHVDRCPKCNNEMRKVNADDLVTILSGVRRSIGNTSPVCRENAQLRRENLQLQVDVNRLMSDITMYFDPVTGRMLHGNDVEYQVAEDAYFSPEGNECFLICKETVVELWERANAVSDGTLVRTIRQKSDEASGRIRAARKVEF